MLRLMKVLMLVSGLSCLVLIRSDALVHAGNGALIMDNPAGIGARLPRLAPLADGSTLLSWIEDDEEGHVLKYAVYEQGHWIRQGVVARGQNWFINWADFPSVAVIDETFWVAHWLVRTPGGRSYDYDIQLVFSRDAGQTWSEPQTPHRDNVAAEHGFVSIFPVEGGAGIIWLDGRAYKQSQPGKFALRYTQLNDNGVLGPEVVIDDDTCTCCWTAAVATSSGPVAAWRGRRAGQIRDHYTARMIGGRWTPPTRLGGEGWSIDGCPVNGPALAAKDDQVAAAWYTAQGNRPRIRVAFSSDAGQHFSRAIDVDSDKPIGRVSLAWLDQQAVLVAWLTAVDREHQQSQLAIRKLTTDGLAGPVIPLVPVSAGRGTGIPQLVRNRAGLILAWTESTPVYRIRTMQLTSGILD